MTQDLTLIYRLYKIGKSLPLIPILDNFNNNLDLFMESKAVLKSTKAQYNLFFLQSVCEMFEFKTNIASTTPYPGLNPKNQRAKAKRTSQIM